MDYKIIVQELKYVAEDKYPKSETIYEQTITNLDLAAVIKAVNQFEKEYIFMPWYEDSKKHAEAGAKGGKKQGKRNNPGNFFNDRKKASRAGKKGGKAKRIKIN